MTELSQTTGQDQTPNDAEVAENYTHKDDLQTRINNLVETNKHKFPIDVTELVKEYLPIITLDRLNLQLDLSSNLQIITADNNTRYLLIHKRFEFHQPT